VLVASEQPTADRFLPICEGQERIGGRELVPMCCKKANDKKFDCIKPELTQLMEAWAMSPAMDLDISQKSEIKGGQSAVDVSGEEAPKEETDRETEEEIKGEIEGEKNQSKEEEKGGGCCK
jgi:hypothetical protein